MVLVHNTSSHRGLQMYQVSLKNLQRFSSYRVDMICDGQTDGRTDRQTHGEKQCLPTLSGGDINRGDNAWTPFSHYKSIGIFSNTQGQITPQPEVGSG